MFGVKPPRKYRGKVCTTRLVHTSVRVPVGNNQGRGSIRKPVSQTPARGWRHQGCEGLVFAFQPNKPLRCCSKKQCMSYFTSADDPRVVAAREPLYDKAMSRTARKKALRHKWRTELVIEHNGRTVPVCLTATCKIFVCSRAFLTFSKTRTRAESNSVRAKKRHLHRSVDVQLQKDP